MTWSQLILREVDRLIINLFSFANSSHGFAHFSLLVRIACAGLGVKTLLLLAFHFVLFRFFIRTGRVALLFFPLHSFVALRYYFLRYVMPVKVLC